MSLPPSPVARARLPWIDHLRTLVIILVVNMHACVTYSHVGDWYVNESPAPPLSVKLGFLYWQAHLQAFFMGLLFFISGYFARHSLQRKGARAFIRERLFRLGLPTLLYMLVLHPLIVAGLNPFGLSSTQRSAYLSDYYLRARFIGESGPLWFAAALLVFCLVLAAAAGRSAPREAKPCGAWPSAGVMVAFAAGLVGLTFLVRGIQPIGTNVLNFQLCFFPQYIAAFVAGVAAAAGGWLVPLARSKFAAGLGAGALFMGPLALTGVLYLSQPIHAAGSPRFFGGWNLPALGYAAWEQLTGIALGLGLLALFSRRFDRETTFGRWLSERSFGVYVLHAPILVALTLWLRPVAVPSAVVMTLALTALGLIASYLAADLAKRIPGLREIL